MSITKGQHFVPRFYLKRFASEADQIFVYDKIVQRPLPAAVNIEKVARSNRFYDLPEEVQEELARRIERGEVPHADEEFIKKAKDPQMIEHHLSKHEGYYAVALTKLLEAIAKKERIDPAHRRIVAHFLIVQRMRTLAFRRMLMNAWKVAASGQSIIVSGKRRRYSLPQIDEKLERVIHANAFTSPDVLSPSVERLVNEVWRIGLNGTSFQLYTTDDPVIVTDTPSKHAVMFPLSGVRLMCPLTPSLLLVIFKQGAMPESAPMSLADFTLTDELVAHANRLQVVNCSRQVYCGANQFELAEAVTKQQQ